MYFSKIEVPPPGFGRPLPLGDPYSVHQSMWALFPEDPNAQRDFLYRQLDDSARSFYVVSARRPQATSALPWQIRTKQYDPRVSSGQRLWFEVRVNPTVTRSDGSRQQRHDYVIDYKKRLESTAEAELPSPGRLLHDAACEWLDKRCESHGFTFESHALRVQDRDYLKFKKGSASPEVTIGTLDLAGLLTVQDPQRFRETLYNGIGRSRSFGCGLLLVRRSGGPGIHSLL